MVHRFLTDERGFLDIYFIIIFSVFVIVLFGMLSATAVAVRKNAVASYQWLQEAGQYAVECAEMNQQTGDPELYEGQIEQYFDAGFASMTQTTCNGNEFDPQAGSPFPGPITITGFSPVQAGDAIPGGGAAYQPGYLISVSVPVMNLSLPLIGAQTVDVPMQCFVSLNNNKSS